MQTTMTIADKDWTIAEQTIAWAEDPECADIATECAELTYAWLVNNTAAQLTGWSYKDGEFSGPARTDALSVVMDLWVQVSDYVIEQFDEIRAEAAAERLANKN